MVCGRIAVFGCFRDFCFCICCIASCRIAAYLSSICIDDFVDDGMVGSDGRVLHVENQEMSARRNTKVH